MNRIVLCLAMTCCMQSVVMAQTLFTYGPYKVDKKEFLWAFRKNNAGAAVSHSQPLLKTYLNLYINYKLKVQAAKDAHLDQSEDFIKDQKGFRTQLTDQTMKKLEGIGRLSAEALHRGQIDIELAQVYVGFASPSDTAAAYTRIKEAFDQLDKGSPFEAVATAYGTNPLLKATGGYTGYVTVFSLPYGAENIVYNLLEGSYSGIYRSHSGYHIFKRLRQRPNPGTFRVSQILLAFSPKATDAEKATVLHRAEMVYDSLIKGASFDSLVRKYSDDKMTYYNYGLLPEFTTGDFDPSFEAAAFALPADGSISRPVKTDFGYHIIKRVGFQPPLTDSFNVKRWYLLQQKIFYNDRMDFARDQFAKSILGILSFRKTSMDTAWLYRIGDSLLSRHGGEEYIKKVPDNPLFYLKEKVYSTHDFLRYLLYKRTGNNNSDPVSFPTQYTAFILASALDYYADHLDEVDMNYKYQVREFGEGTLLFGIMQQEIWNKASADSVGQLQWFHLHKDKFGLPPSADALSFSYPDSTQGKSLVAHLAENPSQWRIWLTDVINVNADSARFDISALSLDSLHAAPGLITAPRLEPDNYWHLYYIVKAYHSSPAHNFEEVKGLVLSDYQANLEKNWLNSLHEKYPVILNQSVFQSLLH